MRRAGRGGKNAVFVQFSQPSRWSNVEVVELG